MTEKLSGSDAVLRQIKAEITRSGHTQKSFAKAHDISPSQLGDWLSGRHQMPVATLVRLLDALGVDYGKFWDGVDQLRN